MRPNNERHNPFEDFIENMDIDLGEPGADSPGDGEDRDRINTDDLRRRIQNAPEEVVKYALMYIMIEGGDLVDAVAEGMDEGSKILKEFNQALDDGLLEEANDNAWPYSDGPDYAPDFIELYVPPLAVFGTQKSADESYLSDTELSRALSVADQWYDKLKRRRIYEGFDESMWVDHIDPMLWTTRGAAMKMATKVLAGSHLMPAFKDDVDLSEIMAIFAIPVTIGMMLQKMIDDHGGTKGR